MPDDVRVRTVTPMLGLALGAEVTLTRSPLVEAAIAEGRFVVLDGDGEPAELKGAALDAALRSRDLPTGGSADEKRARVLEHDAAQAEAAGGPGDVEPVVPVAGTVTRVPGAPVIGVPATPTV